MFFGAGLKIAQPIIGYGVECQSPSNPLFKPVFLNQAKFPLEPQSEAYLEFKSQEQVVHLLDILFLPVLVALLKFRYRLLLVNVGDPSFSEIPPFENGCCEI